jgi:hypothetical protein
MIFNLSEDKRWLILEQASSIEIDQLNISLTKRIKNWRFHPLVKKGIWDGNFSFFKHDKYVQSGLWREVYDIAKEFEYPIQLKHISAIFNNNITYDSFKEWCDSFFKDNPLQPRSYQLETAFKIIKYRKCMTELATSAGKTFIIWIVFAYLKEHGMNKKFLLIVPNVSLVIQGTDDFAEYNYRNKIKYKVQQIYAGQEIKPECDFVIGTYQSLVKKKEEYFDDFGVVVTDECLHSDTLITMGNNSKEKISNVKIGDKVITINDKTNKREIREVDFVYKNLSKGNNIYEIELENGDILKITGNHEVKLINNTYKRVDLLTASDEILSIFD